MKKRTVLIIDDDPDTRALLITVLSRDGFDCMTATDGEEGIAELTANQYDAVLLDLLMPRIDGFELLRHVQTIRRDLLTRIIVLTAASEQTLRQFNSASVFALLQKPADSTGILEVVKACAVKRNRRDRAGETYPDSLVQSSLSRSPRSKQA